MGTMSWDINRNTEGSDPQLEDIQRRAHIAEKWMEEAMERSVHASLDMFKLDKDKRIELISKESAYMGLGHQLERLAHVVLPNTIKEMQDKLGSGAEEKQLIEACRKVIWAKIAKELIENADKLRKI